MRSFKFYHVAILAFLVFALAFDLQANCPGNIIRSRMQCSCGQTINVSTCQTCIGPDCPNCTFCGNFVFCCGGSEAGCLASQSCVPPGRPVVVQVRSADGSSRMVSRVAGCDAAQGGVDHVISGKS